MQRSIRQYWKIGDKNDQRSECWESAYSKLDPGYQWQINSALNNMMFIQHPWKKYLGIACDKRKDLYLLNVSHKGIGDRMVQIMAEFDKLTHTIFPVHCELLKK